MNKNKRKLLADARNIIERAIEIICGVMESESESFDNLTDGLKCTERGVAMEEAVEILDDLVDKLNGSTAEIDKILKG